MLEHLNFHHKTIQWCFVLLVCSWGCRDSKVIEPVDSDALGPMDAISATDATILETDTADEDSCKTNSDCAEIVSDSPCKMFVCSETEERCVEISRSDGTECEDDNLCTTSTSCEEGACIGDTQLDCNDDNVCTDDSCDPEAGCVYTANTADCDDENGCTTIDECIDGICVGSANVCSCSSDDDCLTANDDNLCNGSLICSDEKVCKLDPASIVICPPSESSCQTQICTPETGQCTAVNSENEQPCEDGDLCTLGELCKFGDCIPNAIEDCGGDNNPCVIGTCDPDTGCSFENVDTICDDGNPCTEADTCVEGECIGGENTCACTADADCSSFEDDNACNGTLVCSSNVCEVDPGSIVQCDNSSSSLCEVAVCVPSSGTCTLTPTNEGMNCADDNACTTGEACVNGSCLTPEEFTGWPGAGIVDCNDSNDCTLDTCEPQEGCLNIPSSEACDDGDECTDNDICTINGCTGTPVVNCGQECDLSADCDDDNICTVDTCDSEGLCNYADNGLCECASSMDCNDQNPCTVEICSDQKTCIYSPTSGLCEDGDACSQNDSCFEGACAPGPDLDCEDDNQCTATYCEGGGCKVVFVFSPCEDGDACSVGDICENGSCAPGSILSCDDLNPCTADSCSPVFGCQYEPLGGLPCSPVNACGLEGICNETICLVQGSEGSCCTADAQCDSAAACVTGSCDLGTETCVFEPVLCAEDSELPCSIAYCEEGTCQSSPSLAANEIHTIFTESFEGGEALGWIFNTNNPEVSWNPVFGSGINAGFGMYLGNSTTFTYDYGSVAATAQMPPIAIPADGAMLQFQLLKDVEDSNCPLDVLLISVYDMEEGKTTVLDSICGSTSSFDQVTLSLDAFAGKNIKIEFLFETGNGENNAGYGLVLDNISLSARADSACCESGAECDDGNPCTNDGCGGQGSCIHTPCGDTLACIESGCTSAPCSGEDCCTSASDCEDQFQCTTAQCAQGVCVFPPVVCEDTSSCFVDFCFQGSCLISGPNASSQGQVIYFESFDDGVANGWTFTSEHSTAGWQMVSQENASPPLSLYGGKHPEMNYDMGNASFVGKTPLLALPADQLKLRFQVSADLSDSACDKDVLQVYLTSPASGMEAILLDPPVCESTSGFEQWEIDLSDYGGNVVQIGFAFATKGAQNNQGTGVFIDEVKLVAYPEENCGL